MRRDDDWHVLHDVVIVVFAMVAAFLLSYGVTG